MSVVWSMLLVYTFTRSSFLLNSWHLLRAFSIWSLASSVTLCVHIGGRLLLCKKQKSQLIHIHSLNHTFQSSNEIHVIVSLKWSCNAMGSLPFISHNTLFAIGFTWAEYIHLFNLTMSSCSKISSPVGIFPLKSSMIKLKDLIHVLLKYSQSSYHSQIIISCMSKVSLTQTQSAFIAVKFILYILSNPTSPIASRIKITLGSQHDKSFQLTTFAITWLKYCGYRVKPITINPTYFTCIKPFGEAN